MTLGNKENYGCRLDMLRDVVKRGLKTPLAVTSDGAPGLLRATEEARSEVKSFLEAVRSTPTYEAGKQAAKEVLDRFSDRYPSVMPSPSDDLEASLAHLKVPVRHLAARG